MVSRGVTAPAAAQAAKVPSPTSAAVPYVEDLFACLHFTLNLTLLFSGGSRFVFPSNAVRAEVLRPRRCRATKAVLRASTFLRASAVQSRTSLRRRALPTAAWDGTNREASGRQQRLQWALARQRLQRQRWVLAARCSFSASSLRTLPPLPLARASQASRARAAP